MQYHPSQRLLFPLLAAFVWLTYLGVVPAQAGTGEPTRALIQNEATGLFNGLPLDSTRAGVLLNRVGSSVTSADAEVSPNEVVLHSVGTEFTLDILPVMRRGDVGIHQVAILPPESFGNCEVVGVRISGDPLGESEEDPDAGQFAKSDSDEAMVITLGTGVTATLTAVQVTFVADAVGPVGEADFQCVLIGPDGMSKVADPGNADGDSGDANATTVLIKPGVDPAMTRVLVDPPVVLANGIAESKITTILLDADGQPMPGKGVVLSSSRGGLDILTQPTDLSDDAGVAIGSIRSDVIGVTTITAVDTTDRIVAEQQPEVAFTQGVILELKKRADRDRVVIGDFVPYEIEILNSSDDRITDVVVQDHIPPNFKFLEGSARLNGKAFADPTGNRPLKFAIGEISAFDDKNSNGHVDAGEPGHLLLTYDLVVGSGATPGEYSNSAVATDACDRCYVSNRAEARVDVVRDPFFELGTIVGKVFHDTDRDGRQGRNEDGIPGVMVALDNGTYAITDAHGRYHFEGIEPGQRLIKMNLASVTGVATATTDESEILWITPGILGKANFGVLFESESTSIGKPGVLGIEIEAEESREPIEVVGSVETLDLLINGQPVRLPGTETTLRFEALDEVIQLRGDRLEEPLEFRIETKWEAIIHGWRLIVLDEAGDLLHQLEGNGAPSKTIRWDGTIDGTLALENGGIYQYRFELIYEGGTTVASPRRFFGVNRSTVMSLKLSDDAFAGGQTLPNEDARAGLRQVAQILETFPNEKLLISADGHRAAAAASYLAWQEGISEDRVVGIGTETVGGLTASPTVRVAEGQPVAPSVRINAASVPVEAEGRFAARVPAIEIDSLKVELTDRQGQTLTTALPVPALEIVEPQGTVRLAYGSESKSYRVPERESLTGADTPITHRLAGRTDPASTVLLDGEMLEVNEDGSFEETLALSIGRNSYGLLIQNASGASRIVNLLATVSDRDEDGDLTLVVEPIPELNVILPPSGVKLRSPTQVIRGETDPANRLTVNGTSVEVDEDGRFMLPIELPLGTSTLTVEVIDPDGHVGRVQREVSIRKTDLFLVAIADGVIGQIHTNGYLAGAGQDEQTEYYTEGRIAFYLKGRVAGKYLLTAAFDTGRGEFEDLFKNLDDAGNDRLLTNIDPDRFYPVYGDASVKVYDAESQGKFYLAVDSEEFNLVAGNYAVRLDDTELAIYQRVLFGGRVEYRSASQSPDGEPNTQIVVFGAAGRREHVRSEIRATGGSLYYLRDTGIVEGSEQITLIVRDKITGNVLSRTPQVQNRDYTIKYAEGRIWFDSPIPSVVEGGSLVEDEILAGNPVSIEVEYETSNGLEEIEAIGARAKQQIGEHVAVGGTYIKDERGTVNYELRALDVELRLDDRLRLVGEVAQSEGVDSLIYVSQDGGISYGQVQVPTRDEGEAWKAAAEIDAGAWFGQADRVDLGGYIKRVEPGFQSSGSFQERGTEKIGVNLGVRLGELGRFEVRHERTDRLDEVDGSSGIPKERETTSGSLALAKGRFRLGLEYQDNRTEYDDRANETGIVAGRLEAEVTSSLRTHLRHQSTLTGPVNDQTSAGASYKLGKSLALEAKGTTGTIGESAEGALTFGNDRNRLYLTERFTEKSTGRTMATVFGAERKIGASSRVFTEYQWQQSNGNPQTATTVGAEQQLKIADYLRLNITGEHARTDASQRAGRNTSVSLGVSYDNRSGIKGASRNEVRYQSSDRKLVQYFNNSHIEIGFDPDFTLLGGYRYGVTRDRVLDQTESRFDEYSIGLAYRPIHHDYVNGLARYTHLQDQRPAGTGESGKREARTDVVSAEASIDLSHHIEWIEKFAAKIKEERTPVIHDRTTHTYLSVNRLNLNLWRGLAAGVEYRTLWQHEADDLRRGWLNEILWKMTKQMRIGVGYNFTDFSDNEFSENDYSTHGWFVRLQGKY